MSSRPEHIAPPELYYNEDEAGKYTQASRVQQIQTTMAERCIELLHLPEAEPCVILDIGCGSGISSDTLADHGHMFVGLDISTAMLDVAVQRDVLDAGDLMVNDMGQGFGFRPGVFDGAISVSALQWLCYSDKADHRAAKRLETLFTALYRCLRRGARAALQLYPENAAQLELITTVAMRCGFTGGLVVDFPHSTKAKKYYLCLFAGVDSAKAAASMPKAKGEAGAGGQEDTGAVANESRRSRHVKGRRGKKTSLKGREWVLAKKDVQRRRGEEVRPDSKYSGRKRRDRF